MPTKRPPALDPADAMNAKVLADRAKRQNTRDRRKMVAKQAETAIVEELHPTPVEPATATDFLTEEWDKKHFAETLPTYSKIIYGPDPLLEANPGLREKIEQHGLEQYARATAEAILLKGPGVVPDPMMQKGLAACIHKFGVENTAQSFADRIMRIPWRKVEIEADRGDYLLLQDPLRDAVEKYGRAGFTPKFMSDRSIAILGNRGYVAVKDQRGEVVRVGTLMMFEIPTRIAEGRSRKYREESQSAVTQQEENYVEAAERFIAEAGKLGVGSRPLQRDEIMTANATEEESYAGDSRPAGVHFERQR